MKDTKLVYEDGTEVVLPRDDPEFLELFLEIRETTAKLRKRKIAKVVNDGLAFSLLVHREEHKGI